MFSPNAGKEEPEKLPIRAFFNAMDILYKLNQRHHLELCQISVFWFFENNGLTALFSRRSSVIDILTES